LLASVDSVEAFSDLYRAQCDVALLDLHLARGGASGAKAVEDLVSSAIAVLVLTASTKPSDVLGAIGAGARGCLTKERCLISTFALEKACKPWQA
jgi:DNA-binding NarL/FixJ family response regulator